MGHEKVCISFGHAVQILGEVDRLAIDRTDEPLLQWGLGCQQRLRHRGLGKGASEEHLGGVDQAIECVDPCNFSFADFLQTLLGRVGILERALCFLGVLILWGR